MATDISTAISTSVLLCLLLLLLVLFYRNVLKKIEGFPFSPMALRITYDHLMGKIPKHVPLTSHIFQVAIDACKQNHEEGLFMTYLTRPVLLIFSEEAMKFFNSKKTASDKSPEYDPVTDLSGASILTSNGERYKAHRKIINPAFQIGKLKDKVPLFNEHALRLVKQIEMLSDKSSVDILDALKWNYFSSLMESVLGLKQDEDTREEVLKRASNVDSIMELIVARMIYPWLRPSFLLPFTTLGRKFLKQNKDLKNYVTNLIKDMEKLVASNATANGSLKMNSDATSHRFSNYLQKSFTYMLLNQHLNDPSSFTFQDVHDEVTTIMGAGYDTTTFTTMWCLFLLGLHQEVQEKAFDEVQSATHGDITYEDMCNLTYLEAIIMETLRLYPVVPITARNLTEDVQFGKYKVHKDTTIAFVLYLSHRIPEIFPDPEKFEPERFLSSDERRTGIFIPFSEGNRPCIGQKFAMMEMKIFLAHLLRNFRFISLNKREDIHLCWAVILRPSKNIHMKIIPRRADERRLSHREKIL